ncbi:MAG: hypothetical protein ABF335_06525 [Alphaproteobacteria bacterium]
MENLSTFLAMDGYGTFIWPVYGVALTFCGVIWIARSYTLRSLERAQKDEDQAT